MTSYSLTPKGCLMSILADAGNDMTLEEFNDIWLKFDGWCARQAKSVDPDSDYAALVFDGGGGEVIGVSKRESD